MKQAWSYSRLKSFEECPLSCYWKNYAPKASRLKFEQNQYTRRGSKLHKELEMAVKNQTKMAMLDPVVVQTMSLIRPLLDAADSVNAEMELAFSTAWLPSDWFKTDGSTWLRVIMDLVLTFGLHGVVLDYKTGKVREDNVDQLEITALAAFKYFNRLETIDAGFLWIDHKKKTMVRFVREQVEELDHKYRERSGLIDIVAQSGDWVAKPGYGCKWCQVGKERCGYVGG